MLTALIIILLALALFSYVALPLIHPQGADPLPPERDPVTTDLEEEKAALFRAIRELDEREDLAEERRDQLRARYEAKAALVLRALDERELEPTTPPAAPRRRNKVPYGAVALLALSVTIATALGSYVLPRVGENATVTSFFSEDLDAARALRDARRAAERDPGAESLLALGDAYWRADDAENAAAAYFRAVDEFNAQSALAYRRLGFLSLQTDLGQAMGYLREARRIEPNDLDTLFALGEIHFARGELEEAKSAWRAFLEAPGGSDDQQVLARLELAEELEPLLERVEAEPNQQNLLALADAFWRFDERQRAVEVYFQVLTEFDANEPVALGRTGQLLFISGRNEDAIALMERAATSDEADPQTLLFLGNAYFSADRYREAIDVWERHIALVGEEQAGRVPSLVEDARERLAEREAGPDEATAESLAEAPAQAPAGAPAQPPVADAQAGATVFAENCATCHGAAGAGGAGPRLAGNRRAANEQNVRNAVRFGRGMMPGFAASLDEEQIEAVVAYVIEDLAAGANSSPAGSGAGQ